MIINHHGGRGFVSFLGKFRPEKGGGGGTSYDTFPLTGRDSLVS